MTLLSVAELRKHLPDFPTGSPNDDVLTRLLAAAEIAINDAAGLVGSVTEFSAGGGYYLVLSRPASAFTSVTENFDASPTVLATNDYRLSSGVILSRLNTGTNPASRWGPNVKVVYTAAADTAAREVVQLQLVEQFLNYNPGLTSETVGDWSQTFRGGDTPWSAARDDVLSTLRLSGRMVVVG